MLLCVVVFHSFANAYVQDVVLGYETLSKHQKRNLILIVWLVPFLGVVYALLSPHNPSRLVVSISLEISVISGFCIFLIAILRPHTLSAISLPQVFRTLFRTGTWAIYYPAHRYRGTTIEGYSCQTNFGTKRRKL